MSQSLFSRLWPILILLVSMSSVQSSASLAKYLFPILGPEGMTAWRLFFSACMLSLIFKPWKKRISRQACLPIAVYGIALGMMNLAFYNAIERIPVGIAVAIELAAGPILVALLSSRSLRDFLWLGLAIIGLCLLLPLGQANSQIDLVGILLAAVAGIGWALYILFGKKAGTIHGPSSVALGSILGAIIIFPLGVVTSDDIMFSTSIIPMAFLVAFLASTLPYGLEMIALPRLSAKLFSALMSLSPVLASLSSFIFLHEQLSFVQWLAIILIVISSIGTVLASQKK
ncbi:EamA family transporter [Utexia brackfieldae]|uniref:EamA family transporter n=1 Tax=Utexia brackfieldae TaxID=3074108 RepID=UPI00370DC520